MSKGKAHDRYQSQKWTVLQYPDLSPKEQMRFLDSPVLLFRSPVMQVQVVLVTVREFYVIAQLLCHLSCSPPSPLSFCRSRNGQPVGCAPSQMDKPWEVILYPGDYVSCAVEGYPLTVSAHLCGFIFHKLFSLNQPIEHLHYYESNMSSHFN